MPMLFYLPLIIFGGLMAPFAAPTQPRKTDDTRTKDA